jgi:hypothetical protein
LFADFIIERQQKLKNDVTLLCNVKDFSKEVPEFQGIRNIICKDIPEHSTKTHVSFLCGFKNKPHTKKETIWLVNKACSE